jgi:aspartate racemase
MKTIGIIGGMAWPSTVTYYQTINERISQHMGGLHCANLVLVQTDFDEVIQLERLEDWDGVGKILLALAHRLEAAGADLFVIACNTMHKAIPSIEKQLPIPYIHIVDATGKAVCQYRKVGLLGSQITMSDEFFVGRLVRDYDGLEVLVPPPEEQVQIHTALDNELARGIFLDATKNMFRQRIADLVNQGAEAIILGCTEFGRLVQAEDSAVPLIDTVFAHTDAIVQAILEEP